MLPKIPSLGKAVGSASKNRVKELSKPILDRVNPIKLFKDSVSSFKRELFNELPEFDSIFSNINDFFYDVKKDINASNKDEKTSKSVDKLNVTVKDSSKKSDSIFTKVKDEVSELNTNISSTVTSLLESLVIEIKTLADNFLSTVQNDDGVFDFRNVMDETNNTPDVIDNNVGILDTFIEPVRGMEILVQRTTILRTGAISTGNFQ